MGNKIRNGIQVVYNDIAIFEKGFTTKHSISRERVNSSKLIPIYIY